MTKPSRLLPTNHEPTNHDPPPISILTINPNSTPSVTTALAHPSVAYGPLTPPTGPPPSPCSRPHPQHHPHHLTPPLLPPPPPTPLLAAHYRPHPHPQARPRHLRGQPRLLDAAPTAAPSETTTAEAKGKESTLPLRHRLDGRSVGGHVWAPGAGSRGRGERRGSRAWRRRTWQRWSCMQVWRRRWCGRVREAVARLLRRGKVRIACLGCVGMFESDSVQVGHKVCTKLGRVNLISST